MVFVDFTKAFDTVGEGPVAATKEIWMLRNGHNHNIKFALRNDVQGLGWRQVLDTFAFLTFDEISTKLLVKILS